MNQRTTVSILGLIACLVGTAGHLMAQPAAVRPTGWFVGAKLGLSTYPDDIDQDSLGVPNSDSISPPTAISVEIGYQVSVPFSISSVVGFHGYWYDDSNTISTSYEKVISRLSAQLLGRYTIAKPSNNFGIYLNMGGMVIRNFSDARPYSGIGPILGIGFDVTSGHWSLFGDLNAGRNYETRHPDTDVQGRYMMDASAGLRYNLSKPSTRVGIQSVICPTGILSIRKPAQFTASINEAATEPVETTWEFGDGATAGGLRASHAFERAGTYQVSVTTRNKAGRDREQCSVTALVIPVGEPSLNCPTDDVGPGEFVTFQAGTNPQATQPVEMTWDLGDGSTRRGETVSHRFKSAGTYTATFSATNEAGSVSERCAVTVAPQAVGSPRLACPTGNVYVGNDVTFRATINPQATPPVETIWNMGDGSTQRGETVSHRFESAGRYTATFSATNEVGSASEYCFVTVVPRPVGSPRLTCPTGTVNVGNDIAFRARINPQATPPVRMSWDFGNGSTQNGSNVTHAFRRVGGHTVTLTATNAAGTASSRCFVTVGSLSGLFVRIAESGSLLDAVGNLLFGDDSSADLAVEVESGFNVGASDLEVEVVAEEGLDRCTYRNDEAIWSNDRDYKELDASWSCSGSDGAAFPLNRIGSVRATVGGGILRAGRSMTCYEATPPGTQSPRARIYACN